MLTSPSPSPAACPQCNSPTGRFDRFCGICGTHLARLRWQPPGCAWQEGSGQLAVTEGATAARVTLENHGVVSLALILDDRSLDALPDWIDLDTLYGQELLLAPGAQHSLEVSLRGEALLSRAELELSELQRHEVMLSFLTSASDRPLKLTLVLALQPWVQPAASLYRFLPIERLREGVVHEIQLHNAAAAPAELDRIVIEDDPVAPPVGYVRIPGEHLLRRDVQLPVSLPAGEVWTHRLILKAAELPLPEDALGWFSARIHYELKFNNEPQEVVTRLSGAVGRGPTLELRGSPSITSNSPDVDIQHSFSFRNTGQLPVEVLAVETLREREGRQEPASGPDWLLLKGLKGGDLVGPGEERTLIVGFQPDARPSGELGQEWSSRTILVRHDGWQETSARQLLCQVVARLGGAQEGTLGIDFGTSNSVACLMGETHGYPLMLEVFDDGRRGLEQLASLMYFNGSSAGTPDTEPFLYGDEAKGAAANAPANLVRSIKTVVIDGARSGYGFLKKAADGSLQHLNLTPQEVLNFFIRQMKLRAERGVALLPPETLDREGLNDRRVAFRNAVFSHPVDVTDAMKAALMQAAQRAGINLDFQAPDEFFEERCVDEATAAVLAYINQVLLDHSEGRGKYKLKDLEKILCVDVGGGTTDIAAVAVKDMAAYDLGKAPKVAVELWNRDGDRRFAGDALDRLLAKEILTEIERQSREQGAAVLVDEVMYAILSPSFTAYQAHFQERLKGDPRRRNAGQADPYAVYSRAVDVLEKAEAAKRNFTSEAQVKKSFTGTGWPRERDDPAAASQNFEVVLQREIFEEIVRRELGQRLPRLDAVMAGAHWDWPSVTTLLLTGQSMKSPILRRPIVEYVRKKMSKAAKRLVVVEPDDGSGFDPKACVAIGAAIWGISRIKGNAWLTIHKPFLEQLTFDLTTRGGPRFVPIEGLQTGASLPAKGVLDFPAARKELILYKNKQRYVHFANLKPATRVTVLVESLADYFVEIDGEKIRGEILQ